MKGDIETAVYSLIIAALIVFFWGDPDIHDAIIYRLMAGG